MPYYYFLSLEVSVIEMLEKGILKGDSEILGKFHKGTWLCSCINKWHCPGIHESCIKHAMLEWGQQKEIGLGHRKFWPLSQNNSEIFPLFRRFVLSVYLLCVRYLGLIKGKKPQEVTQETVQSAQEMLTDRKEKTLRSYPIFWGALERSTFRKFPSSGGIWVEF